MNEMYMIVKDTVGGVTPKTFMYVQQTPYGIRASKTQ